MVSALGLLPATDQNLCSAMGNYLAAVLTPQSPGPWLCCYHVLGDIERALSALTFSGLSIFSCQCGHLQSYAHAVESLTSSA